MDKTTTKVFACFPPAEIVRVPVMVEYSGSPLEDVFESQNGQG